MIEEINKTNTVCENTESITKEKFPVSGDGEFDIADFIVKHNTVYSVKKKRVWVKVLGIVTVILMIAAICVLGAVLTKSKSSNSLFGKWKSSDGILTEFIELEKNIDGKQVIQNYMIIGENDKQSSMRFIFEEEENVISLEINGEFVKMIYSIENNKLTLTMPFTNIVQKLEYTKVNQ